jgi:hypothetical protein
VLGWTRCLLGAEIDREEAPDGRGGSGLLIGSSDERAGGSLFEGVRGGVEWDVGW